MTESDARDSQRLEVEIFNLTFRLKAPPDEHERLRRAARHVDTVMRELMVSQTSPDTARLAIQSALLISRDYLKLMDDIATADGVTSESRRRVDELVQRLDESLRSL